VTKRPRKKNITSIGGGGKIYAERQRRKARGNVQKERAKASVRAESDGDFARNLETKRDQQTV